MSIYVVLAYKEYCKNNNIKLENKTIIDLKVWKRNNWKE